MHEMQNIIFRRIHSARNTIAQMASNTAIFESMEWAAKTCITSLTAKGKILVCGNGGSAADAQHFAAELVGRFREERKGLPAIALTADTACLTAIANDYGYEHVFSRQVEAFGKHGDTLLCISTSGNSPNIINAATTANRCGIHTIGLTGGSGGELVKHCEKSIIVPYFLPTQLSTAHIQEAHIVLLHILCELIENRFMIGNA